MVDKLDEILGNMKAEMNNVGGGGGGDFRVFFKKIISLINY